MALRDPGRLLAAAVVLATLSACHTSMSQSQKGQTPAPMQTTLAQANSTAAPDNGMTQTPGDKYFAKESAASHGVAFSIWANGRPITTILTPGQSVELTASMRGHANRIAVQWEKRSKKGAGTLTIGTAKQTAVTVTVDAHSAAKGQTTHTIIASQSPNGR